jgi:hypothetical protein
MTLPILRVRPARGIAWAGPILILLCSLLDGGSSAVQAASRQDEPPPPSPTDPLLPSPSPENTLVSTPSSTNTIGLTPSPTPSTSATLLASITPVVTPDATATAGTTPTISPTPSLEVSPTIAPIQATPTDAAVYPPGTILISEVAWAGTLASAHDEWIELYNPGSHPIDLHDWALTDHADIDIHLTIRIAPFSFALLERTDDTSVANIPADQIYTGSLKNGGDSLFLLDPSGGTVDSANADGGPWPAGDSPSRASMERRGGDDQSGNWATFTGMGGLGLDCDGNPIPGSPRSINSIHIPIPSPSAPTPPVATPTSPGTPTHTATPPASYTQGAILINEVAWAGTLASASDEWIELLNPGETTIMLDGWRIHDDGDLAIALAGMIKPHGYYLLERGDDQTIADIPADLTYIGSLSNSGDRLQLLDPVGALIDSANIQGGSWPAGNHKQHTSMERRGGEDRPGDWATFTGFYGNGIDAAGNSIRGTPRQTNSIFFPTPQPTWIPGKLVINEVLIRPHYDWEGRGGVDTGDEFIEILNLGPLPVNLRGWLLDDIEGAGSKPYTLPAKTVDTGEYAVFFRSRTHIALNDSGDVVRLLAPDGRLIDQLSYLRVRAYNLSYGRFPDRSGHLSYGLWPTPGQPNLLFLEDTVKEVQETVDWYCSRSAGLTLPLAQLSRNPLTISRISSYGYRLCWRHE